MYHLVHLSFNETETGLTLRNTVFTGFILEGQLTFLIEDEENKNKICTLQKGSSFVIEQSFSVENTVSLLYITKIN